MGAACSAIDSLDAIETRFLAWDAPRVWGQGDPMALPENAQPPLEEQMKKAPTLYRSALWVDYAVGGGSESLGVIALRDSFD